VNIGDTASFNGENFLSVDSSAAGYNSIKEVVASFTRTGSTISIGTIGIDITQTTLFDAGTGTGIIDTVYSATSGATFTVGTLDISALTDSAADLTDLEDMIQAVDTAFTQITTGASNLGAAIKRIDMQSDFVSSLMDAIERGVGQLVDADMNEESTRLQALQVQQQLGIQSLSIANSGSQNILSLFN
ncbi:MAG: flagellin, partial [Pseudomonadota bacterium]